jgi:23S rRNA (cytosine1962-C5)-methyltransferase
MTLPKLKIKANHDKRLVNGSLWIYSNEIENFSELKTLPKGELVEILSSDNQSYGIAYFNSLSLIAARILSKDIAAKINEIFFIKRITNAKNLRDKFYYQPFYRLIHSEADFLPGLIIDRFGDYLSCQISTFGMENLKEYLILALEKLFPEATIIFRNDIESRKIEGLELYSKVVRGKEDLGEIEIIENNLKFLIDPLLGQKTGWFFDQRKNRQFIGEISSDLQVLDLFCYNGGFGLNALNKGAKSVTFVDSSARAIEKLRKNITANNFENNQYELLTKKVVELLEDEEFQKRKFDLVIIDPPALIKSKKDFFAGIRLYEKLVKLSASLVKKGGFLFIASCSHNASNTDLIEAANNGFRKARKKARLIRQYGADLDHPIHPALKESEYLKSLCFYIE